MPVPEELRKKPQTRENTPSSTEEEEGNTQTAPPPPQRGQAPPTEEMPPEDEYGGEEEYPEGEEDYPEGEDSPDEEEMGGEEEMAPQGEQEPPEKYSAQVLRRVHHDSMILLQDYDEMRQFLEHEEVDSFLEKKLQNTVSDLEEIEELFAKHHPEAAPLEGGKDWDGQDKTGEMEEAPEGEEELGEEENPEQDWEETPEGDEMEGENPQEMDSMEGEEENPDEHEVENEADSREEDEPTEDEVAEEMTRSPKQGKKSLRRRVKSKAPVPGYEEDQNKPGFPHSDATLPGEPGYEEHEPHSGKPVPSLAPQTDLGVEEHRPDKPGVVPGDDEGFASLLTQPMHMGTVEDTQSFLTQVGGMETQAWNPDHQMEAHHLSRSLGSLANGGGAKGKKAMKGKEPLQPYGGKRGKVQACAKFLGELSREKALGDVQRQKAMEHLKELDFMGGQDKESGEETPQVEGSPEEMGDIGQKSQNPPLGRPDRPSREEWEEPPSDEDVVNDVDQAMEQGRYVRPDHVVDSSKPKGKRLRRAVKSLKWNYDSGEGSHIAMAPQGGFYEIYPDDRGYHLWHQNPQGTRRHIAVHDDLDQLMNHPSLEGDDVQPDAVVEHRESNSPSPMRPKYGLGKRLPTKKGQKALPQTPDPLSQVAKTVAARGKQLETLTKQLNGLVNLT